LACLGQESVDVVRFQICGLIHQVEITGQRTRETHAWAPRLILTTCAYGHRTRQNQLGNPREVAAYYVKFRLQGRKQETNIKIGCFRGC
jgi:hypothetical protein